MDNVARLPESDRNALFGETARIMKTTPAITEKDFWVVWVLGKLFCDARLRPILQFKGGTSGVTPVWCKIYFFRKVVIKASVVFPCGAQVLNVAGRSRASHDKN